MALPGVPNSSDASVDPDDEGGRWLPIKVLPALVVLVIMAAVVLTVRCIRSARPVPPSQPLVFVSNGDAAGGERLSLPTDSLFDYDRSDIKEAGITPIKDFAAKAKGLDAMRIVVIGHTDPTGRAAHNDQLSLARAEAVRKVLLGEGLAKAQVSTAGVGSRIPLKRREECPGRDVDPKVVACLAPDRRVELWVKTVETPTP